MQKLNWNLGIPSLFALHKSRKKFCQDSGSGKRWGIIQGAFHSLFRKRKNMPWYHSFFIQLDYDSCVRWTECLGWKGKKLRNETTKTASRREREKKWRHRCFGQHFSTHGGAKQRREPGALGKWMYFLFAAKKQTAKAAELHYEYGCPKSYRTLSVVEYITLYCKNLLKP